MAIPIGWTLSLRRVNVQDISSPKGGRSTTPTRVTPLQEAPKVYDLPLEHV
jgi:hypothetical protein